MNLSPKAVRFIVDALDYRINTYRESLSKDLEEDEVADLTNDCLYLESIRGELAKARESKVP
ncbi:MAG: hypothetical protein WA902_05660, partial [Thermosynechococcaceae cyanobacterium]